MTRLFTVLMLAMVSMGAWADVDVQIANDGKFDGGTIKYVGQTKPDEKGFVTVTITVAPDKDYTIKKNNITVVSTYPPSDPNARTRTPDIAENLTLYFKGSADADTDDPSAEREYTFDVPSGFGAWVKEAEFQSSGKKEPTRNGFSGTYFIGVYGSGKTSQCASDNSADNFYLCPTEDWCYYAGENQVQAADNGQPFLTSYKCRDRVYDERKAVWVITKHSTEDYYYIQQPLTGRYLVFNDQLSGAGANRVRVHLETITSPAQPNDYALFAISTVSTNDDRNGYWLFHPKKASDGYYLNITAGNVNSFSTPSNGKTDGPTGYNNVGGIIGQWNEANNTSSFHPEPAASVTTAPTITNNFDGTISISATSSTIYYTTDGTDPTTSSTPYSSAIELTDDITVIKAMAKDGDNYESRIVTYELPKCDKPVITISSGTVTITTATEGASIRYTDDDTPPASSSTLYNAPFSLGDIAVIRAIAVKTGYAKSEEAYYADYKTVSSSSEITNMQGLYRLASDFNSSAAIGTSEEPFRGTIDGQMNTISDLDHPLVAYANGATIKNVILNNISISGGTNAGAICNEARGASRIYNCGVLATNSTVKTDDDGYTSITSCSSTISGSGYVGGIVGLLDGSSRVINCFSYANITGGNLVGGIVGNNKVATTSTNLKTMVMNCMFYGDIDTEHTNNRAPIYNGENITNLSTEYGVSNFNYFWAGASYVQNQKINTYNCALAAETRFLQRFEFFRPLLNSNRTLAAWWATGNRDNKAEIMKWVLEPSQIGTSTPYPILKAPGRYKSVVYIDDLQINETAHEGSSNSTGTKLSTLSVSIQKGSGGPTNATISIPSLSLDILDKDPDHFNFNYYKVQLPYYNDVGTLNYTDNKVVTGWEVTVSGGTHNFTTSSSDASASVNEAGDITLTATPYNFADRKSTEKDNYETNGNRIFNQGAYFDVPDGVTSITIKPHWAKCVYVSDEYPDVVYNMDMDTKADVTTVGGGSRYSNGTAYNINGSSQNVYTTMSAAVTGLNPSSSSTVYDNAIVLVGNVHSLDLSDKTDNKPYTIMSIDLDKDNEPDYSYILRFDGAKGRLRVHPVRIDFLNVVGLGMAQKSSGGQGTYNFGIMQPLGWFEVTNTGLFRVTQFEYDRVNRKSGPMILQGGVIEQWVTVGETEAAATEANLVDYYHVGGNVWFKEFHIGAHQDKPQVYSPHPPISVTGGDFDEFYLTGMYNTPNNNNPDNAECYINGGRFGKVAGTGMQGIGKTNGADNTGNIIWQIDNADIDEFYAGGINAAHKAEGNIWTVISNSRVDQFCGGPKFGDMNNGKVVVTNASNCTFRTFFGAGYGGNSYNREYPKNKYEQYNYAWNSWLKDVYKNNYKSDYKGVATRIDYQFIPRSNNVQNVARLFVDYISFSLATTHDVTSKLTDCTITKAPLGRLDLFDQCIGNFYGGGSLGKVDGPVKSTLTDCTVEGNAFGAGYSASVPSVKVMNNSFQKEPEYDENLGAYLEAKLPATETYTWQHRDESIADAANDAARTALAIDVTNHILYTNEDLTALGKVTGTATLNIDGTTTVAGNIYGGGEESNVEGNTVITMSGGTIGYGSSPDVDHGNVFGGGKGVADNFTCDKAMVGVVDTGIDAQNNPLDGGTTVTITNGTVKGDVYGGGEVGRVERNTIVTIGEAGNTTLTPIIEGHVFGAGKGLETHGYSALVRGNATVTIQGQAQVWQNVHGGGEKASVGRYNVRLPGDTEHTEVRVGMPYSLKAGGKCTVNIQDGAVIGKDDIDDSGDIYGAGQGIRPSYNNIKGDANRSKRMVTYTSETDYPTGDVGDKWDYYADDHNYVWEYFATKDDYLLYVETLARASETDVVIGGKRVDASTITPSSTAPTIKGSVYGGSESGFVYYGTMVNIPKGTIKGDAFGGGKGLADFQEAGRVKRNTSLTISGGTVEGNVYGGGSLGDVGTIDKSDQTNYNYTWTDEDGNPNGTDESKNTGVCNVYMTGGTVGAQGNSTANHASGHVFGAGKGSGVGSYYCEQGMVYKTNVSISKGTVYGNVYGGGEVGRVENNATVKIGPDSGDDIAEVKGSVFGAGAGLETHGYSALVRNNTDVTVQGHAKVRNNVYGGGEIAAVGRYWVLLDPPISGAPQAPTGTIVGMPYQQRSGGVCTVIVKGQAEIGPNEGAATDLAGHVFGGGKGVTPHYNPTQSQKMTPNGELVNLDSETDYKEFLETLALVTNTSVTIGDNTDANGAVTVKGSVFGGSENGFVQHNTSVSIQKGSTIGTSGSTYGNVYGGGKGLSDFAAAGRVSESSTVAIGGGTIWGSVYGGGTYGYVKENVTVNVTGGEVKKDVYGGGALAHTNTANWTGTGLVATYPYHVVTGLTVGESVVTGFYTESSGTYTKIETANTKAAESTTYYRLTDTRVNLLGGLVKGDAYGGGLGDLAAIGTGHSDVAAMVYGDVSVTLGDDDNATKFNVSTINDNEGNPVVSSGRVFGCNNLNGSPMGSVLVTVNKTVAGNYSRTAEDPDNTGRPPMGDASPANRSYEVAAVYGGGNLSDYVPYSEEGESEKRMPRVRLTTCDISVEEVYGGGNAAKVPATDVQILGAYEIENVFGGGNGADKYTLNGTDWIINPGANVGSEANPGDANTLMKGGYIHSAYGGSNLKGEIFGTVYIDKTTGGCDGCPVQVDKMVAAGNNADFNSDVKVVVGCQGSDKTPMRFFGADNANVNGNVEVTITSGHFGKVFAGNNIGGAIRGHIIMNIEETSDCEPIRIDELYLGGNEAAYSRFGYYIKTTTSEGESATGYGDVTEEAALEDGRLVFMPRKSEDDPHYPVNTYNRETNTWTVIKDKNNYPLYANPVLNIISCTEIKEVFGGGYGDGAVMYADPTVNINMIKGSNYTNISATDDNPNQLGEIGEVFGGGNAAVVEGNTTVNVGMATTVDLISTEETGKTVLGAYITGSVFGGGNEANVTGDTHVNICGTQNPVLDSESNPVLDSEGKPTYTDTSVSHSGTFAVSIGNTVYGGGNAADVKGNTFVTFADGYVFNGIFGGGLSGSVGTFTTSTASADVNIWGHTAHNGTCIGKPTACTSGGTCYVVVSGGQIGPVTVATEGMNRKTNGHGNPVPQGWVWGAGCGLVEDPSKEPDTHFKTYVNNTDVTIKGNAFILESIIGGGEFGRVLGNTLVKIEGGQIGVGADQTETVNGVLKPKAYTTTQWTAAETAVRLGTASDINTAAAAMPACSHFPYGRNTGTEQAPNWVYETYDPYADLVTGTKPYPGGSTDNASDGKTWIGCVFAGGSGYMPYTTKDNEDNITGYDWVQSAGWVEGNAEVRISGGHILTNVYGGNEYTDVKGTCKVTMTGGTVGVPRTVDQIMANPMIGHIFGAGKGDPRVHFNKVTNVGDVEVEITGGIVYGSVFGGGEDGHVLRNVKMTIDEGAKIGTWGTTYIDGNVFGGGRGYSGDAYTAGNVAGSVEVEIKGGQILGSVYGGGQLGSVGYGLFDATTDGNPTPGYGEMRKDTDTETGFNTSGDFTEKGRGHIDLTISGGTIGNNYEYIMPQTGSGGNTPTTITETDFTKWSDTDWTIWKDYNYIPKTEFDTTTGRVSHTKGGNVFAGGMGRIYQLDDTTPISAVDWWKMGCVKSTKLTISGDAVIKSTVFGGGELGQVVGYHTAKNAKDENVNVGTEVIINGGTIGTEIKESGDVTRFVYGSVFGGGYGSLVEKMTHTGNKPDSYPKYIAGRVKAGTKVKITDGTVVRASVYGGGKMAAVGESTVLAAQTDPVIPGETLTVGHTGDTHVIISGGTIGEAPLTLSDNSIRYFGGAKVGNVYGGGSGHNNTVRSGHVYGNTNVTISDGTIYHNVYGGGAYGSVGEFEYQTTDVSGAPKVSGIKGLSTDHDNTGVATVTITGGTIGVNGKENGMVFGSSRGDINKPEERDDHTAWVYDANVTIGDANGGPAIKGSVYGSGENGHTFNNAVVTVNKGTIGIAEGEDITYTENGQSVTKGGAAYPYRGNVYGGGCGTDKYYSDHAQETHDGNGQLFNPLAGIVYGNTTVNINGGTIVRNVYGAGAMGSVGKLNTDNNTITGGTTTINISGGTIGVSGTVGDGNVFGAARGDVDAISNEAALVRKATDVSITGGTIKGNVYGGGELGCVGTYTISPDYRTFTWQDTAGQTNTAENSGNKNTGICNVIIDGSSTVINGHVFGAGKGKDDTFWCEKGIAYRTIVNVKNGTVNGNVYGGGEVGRVETDTEVKVGLAPGEGGGTSEPTINGSVFGGGAGVETHGYSALVRGNTTVTVDQKAHVAHSVYGGGEIASVGKYGLDDQNMPSILQGGGYCYVTVQGNAAIAEDVFGAGKGVTPHFDNTNADLSKQSRRMTLKNGWESFVGDERFEWDYLQSESAYSTYLETLALVTHPKVTIDGNAAVSGSVFGGGELGLTKGSVIVNIQGGTIAEDVYGGGKLANTNTTSLVDLDGDGNTETVHPTTTVNLYGGLIKGDAYGGGLGQKTGFYDANGVIATSDIEATVYGDITVNLGSIVTPATETKPAVLGPATAFNIHYEETGDKDEANNPIKVVQSGRVFGCNNLNGSPQGNVTVNVFKTVEGNVARTTTGYKIKEGDEGYVAPTYELAAVYGGGNLADYTATDKKASVIIHTCDVSVQHVYGGGNAAAVPETDVLVKGAWEIEHVFGGGNGKDKYKRANEWIPNPGANVLTNTNTLLIGGYIHEAYGGSNESGTISGNVTINTDSKDARCVCDLELVKLYGAGKNADIDGDLIVVLDCAPETKTEEIYGGAENANVRGNVELTITSGSFGKVFGGNNQSGAIFGHIILNIEETSCRPIIIDELYGCGNNAAYSVYGYKEGTDADGYKIYVPRTSFDDGVAVTFNKDENQTAHTTPQYADPQVNIISCTRIGQVFGGGYGAGATVWGNPTVNINQIYGKAYSDANKTHYDAVATSLGEIGEVFGGGNEANVVGNTTVNIGTASTVQLHQSYDKKNGYSMSDDKPVLGANITGNVYGGGNKANVSGNTNVNIGKATTTTNTTTTP